MKINKKNFLGYWFGLGAVLTVFLVLIHLAVGMNRSNELGVTVSLCVGGLFANFCGRRWGDKIFMLGPKKLFKAVGYGILIGLITLYAIIFVMLSISFSQTEFLKLLHAGAYLKIGIIILKIPGLTLFGMAMGCILEPLVLLLSGLGGGVLYLLRHRIKPFLIDR